MSTSVPIPSVSPRRSLNDLPLGRESDARNFIERDPSSGRIIGIQELSISMAIFAGRQQALLHRHEDGSRQLSLTDLAVCWGCKEIGVELVQRGVLFHGLDIHDFFHADVGSSSRPTFLFHQASLRTAVAIGERSTEAAAFLRNLRFQQRQVDDMSTEQSALAASLLDLAVMHGEPLAARALSMLGVPLANPRHLMIEISSWHGFIAAMSAGVDPSFIGTGSPSSILDRAFEDHLILEDILKRRPISFLPSALTVIHWLADLGATSTIGRLLGTHLVGPSTNQFKPNAVRLGVNLDLVKTAVAVGINVRQLIVDLELFNYKWRSRVQSGQHAFWMSGPFMSGHTLLGISIKLGQSDVAMYLVDQGCEDMSLHEIDLNRRLKSTASFHEVQFDAWHCVIAAKAALRRAQHKYRVLMSKLASQWEAKASGAMGTPHGVFNDHVINHIVSYALPFSLPSLLDFKIPLPFDIVHRISLFLPWTVGPVHQMPRRDHQEISETGERRDPERTPHAREMEVPLALPRALPPREMEATGDTMAVEDEDDLLPIDEPVAEIGVAEAAHISNQRWATWVEQQAQGALEPRLQETSSRAIVLSFSRHTRELEEAILQSAPALSARARGVEVMPSWARGAKILVADVGPECFDQNLGPYQVIVSEDDEEALNEALQTLPYRFRKPKPGTARAVVPEQFSLLGVSSSGASSSSIVPGDLESSAPSAADEDEVLEIRVERTFIHVAGPAFDTRSHRTW